MSKPKKPKPIQKDNSFVSSTIAATHYDPNGKTLLVTFKSGGVYQYQNVGEQRWEAMQAAESKGRFLAKHIKPRYKVKKIS